MEMSAGNPKTPDEPVVIDARGLNCPLPLLKLKKAVALAPLVCDFVVLATDRGSAVEIEGFARKAGWQLAKSQMTDGTDRYELTRR